MIFEGLSYCEKIKIDIKWQTQALSPLVSLVFISIDNPMQNILRKFKKQCKVRQDQKVLISFFYIFFEHQC